MTYFTSTLKLKENKKQHETITITHSNNLEWIEGLFNYLEQMTLLYNEVVLHGLRTTITNQEHIN